jgi:hypothetical protein
VVERVCIAGAALVITALAVALVAGHGPWAGPLIVTLSSSHGIHAGDLPVMAGWLVGMACCNVLWRRSR